ncbi:MAG: glutamyl-tRNA reductase [Deltaproteobacteria bacterium]|nr:glutamyl-tRNA reductase [Deltaproteobacteria bacterium]MBW1929037.1 glutamyl-tRNA reductase [Deltaproteobacteria bacterium]MBW2024570.1 glutamyl-tRNA reductase [Deltaproteobacteria bacterium]MBW2125370.1 glutamyl-tRNA reductase [Deltaproteobacteria bacterium]RLB23407.1 MAG: glutamyl-tRNA reductase [Deltaproteobacteria bacterium]
MSTILNIGMNHQTAPVELRECLAGDPMNSKKALNRMRSSNSIKEAFFLSTCNRVEALVVTDDKDRALDTVISLMAGLGNLPREIFSDHLYSYEDMEAVRHVFRVASSLDSMVVGEPQILGQIKSAYVEATREKTSGVIINRLMHRAFHVAKRVRTETGISEAAVSISYAAVELAKKIFHELRGKKVLLIGAGEMAELAGRHFMNNGVTTMTVANRTFERAVEVSQQFDGTPVSLEEIPLQLLEVDIVLSSTASPEVVITRDMVKGCLRKRRNRPLFFIDIAVPRDIDPKVNDLENVYLYDIDDLRGITESNLAQRQLEAAKAERIVEEEVVKFEKWLKTLAVVPTLVALREKAEAIVQSELSRSNALISSLNPTQREAVLRLSRSIVEKILNDPILFLKGKAGRSTLPTYLDITRKLFRLDDNGQKE